MQLLAPILEKDAEGSRHRPDGDVVLDDHVYHNFEPAACLECGGVLKPNVVFFGGTVPSGGGLAPAALQAAHAPRLIGSVGPAAFPS
jgi:NAD-dependent SIR2 family protein deacetylase